jgi:hypothetical protein
MRKLNTSASTTFSKSVYLARTAIRRSIRPQINPGKRKSMTPKTGRLAGIGMRDYLPFGGGGGTFIFLGRDMLSGLVGLKLLCFEFEKFLSILASNATRTGSFTIASQLQAFSTTEFTTNENL